MCSIQFETEPGSGERERERDSQRERERENFLWGLGSLMRAFLLFLIICQFSIFWPEVEAPCPMIPIFAHGAGAYSAQKRWTEAWPCEALQFCQVCKFDLQVCQVCFTWGTFQSLVRKLDNWSALRISTASWWYPPESQSKVWKKHIEAQFDGITSIMYNFNFFFPWIVWYYHWHPSYSKHANSFLSSSPRIGELEQEIFATQRKQAAVEHAYITCISCNHAQS